MERIALALVWWLLVVSVGAAQSPAARGDYDAGVALRAKKDLQGALAALTRAVKSDPSFSEAWRQRGLVHSDMQRLDEAMSDFERAIEADPRNARAYVGRAFVKGRRNDRAGAEADCTRAIEIDPGYASAYMNRAANRRELGNPQGALADLDRAIELDARNALALYNRGVVKMDLKDDAGARADLDKSLEVEGKHAYAAQARHYLAQISARARGQGAPSQRTVTTPSAGAAPEGLRASSPAAVGSEPVLAASALMDETTWTLKEALWQKAGTPLPPADGHALEASPPPPLDFNRLTPAHYAAAITAAKEGMRLLAGDLTPDQEKLFEAKWVPYYDYPCQEVIAYLNRFNPLMSEFLAVRAAAASAASAYDEGQLDLLAALDNRSEDDVLAAMEILSRQRTIMRSLAARMRAVAAKIDALGEIPNPLALKGRARRLHDAAADWLDPADFEGLWRGPEAKQYYYKVVSRYPDGRLLVYYCPVSDVNRTRTNAREFLADTLGVVEKTSDGAFVHLDWSFQKIVRVLQPAGKLMKVGTYIPAGPLSPMPQFDEASWALIERSPKLIPVPSSRPWTEVAQVAAKHAARKQEQYLRWRKATPEEFDQARQGPNSASLVARKFEAGLQEIREIVARRRGADIAQMEANLDSWETRARAEAADSGRKVDREAERRRRVAEIDDADRAQEAQLVAKLRADLGMAQAAPPAPAAPGPDAETARRPQAEQEVLRERVALIEANIAYFERRLAETHTQLGQAADDASRERLRWSIMALERNLQDERDQLTTLRTGQWTRTRTTFDAYCAELEAEHSRKAADDWTMLSRMLSRVERQIASADPADRDRLRQLWLSRVTPDVIARGDFDAVRATATEIFKASQKNLEAEVSQAQADLAWEETKLAYAENVKAAADASLIALSTVAGPAGDVVYAFYNATTGYIDGGLAEAFRRPVMNYSAAVRVADAAIQGYTQGVVDNILRSAENPGAVKLDETGAGLSGALWGAGKHAAFEVGMRVAVAAVGRVLGGKATVPEGRQPPTAQQLIAESRFRLRQSQGRQLVNDFIEKSRALETAAKGGASKNAIATLKAEADAAYKAIKADYHAKSYLKTFTRHNKKAVHCYNSFDRVHMRQFQARVQTEMSRLGYTTQRTRLFSNSASQGGVGMDVDLGFDAPPQYLGAGARRMPNPEYQYWLDGLTKKGKDGARARVSPRAYQEDAKRVMRQQFVEQFGHQPDEAFLNFTHGGDAEAYKNLAWIGRRGLKTADFAALQTQGPSYAQQAGDVTRFKVDELANGHPSLGTYSLFQEQCRGMVKDMNTKLMGSAPGAPLNPAAPLSSAPKPVQEHFIQLRRVMDDFANNRIGPIEAERAINQLTGGRGMAEVADRFATALQGGLRR